MNRPSRNHHFVPRSLLKRFSIDGLGKQIHVYEKRTGRTFAPAIENAGSENDFNTLELPDGMWNFEPLFDEIDQVLHHLLEDIHASRSVSALSEAARFSWADVVVGQLIRTPLMRHTHVQTASDIAASLMATGLVDPSAFSQVTDNDSRAMTVALLLQRAPLRAALLKKDLVLYAATGPERFWISDNPVVVDNPFPYGDAGIASPGAVIYLPLGSSLLLGLMCKSIGETLNARPIERLDVPAQDAAEFIAVREALRTGEPIVCAAEQVLAFNQYQVARSKRFVYSQDEASAAMTQLLERNPKLREPPRRVHVGKMGEGPGPALACLTASGLVLFGVRNHYMARVNEWKRHGYPIEVTIEDVEVMNRALRDAPFSDMRLYLDQREVQGMRDVRIEVLSPERPARISIRHSDSGLDGLLTKIREQ